MKISVLKISQNLQENICARVSFLITLLLLFDLTVINVCKRLRTAASVIGPTRSQTLVNHSEEKKGNYQGKIICTKKAGSKYYFCHFAEPQNNVIKAFT